MSFRALVYLLLRQKKRMIEAFLILYALFHIHMQVFSQEEEMRTDILEQVNKVRKEGCICGNEKMPPAGELTWNDKLERAAIGHVNDMFTNENLSHTGSDGSSLSDRAEKEGYRWFLIGENISWGYLTALEVVEGWKASPGHCMNMMNGKYTEMGAARKGTYWVLDLGDGK